MPFLFCIISGVLQVGYISLLLFLLFINDLYSIFRVCKHSFFANDLFVYGSKVPRGLLQDNFVRFSNLYIDNYLKINIDKCAQISSTRREN